MSTTESRATEQCGEGENFTDLRQHMYFIHPQFCAPYALNLHSDEEVARLHADAVNNFPPEPWEADGDNMVTVLICRCGGDRFRAVVRGHRDIGFLQLRCVKCLKVYPVDYTDC